MIVNPRGTSGSGKTELVRRIAADYGWGRSGRVEPVYRRGRERPIAYRLRHPLGGRPLAVLGHYEATSGGCDTISAADGGMDEAFRLAGGYAADGHDVLLEGLLLSGEHVRSAALAREHGLHVLRLDTPLDRCIRNVIARQRAGRRGRASAARTATTQQAGVEEACRRLRRHATVEVLDFDGALLRARELLGLGRLAEGAEAARLEARTTVPGGASASGTRVTGRRGCSEFGRHDGPEIGGESFPSPAALNDETR